MNLYLTLSIRKMNKYKITFKKIGNYYNGNSAYERTAIIFALINKNIISKEKLENNLNLYNKNRRDEILYPEKYKPGKIIDKLLSDDIEDKLEISENEIILELPQIWVFDELINKFNCEDYIDEVIDEIIDYDIIDFSYEYDIAFTINSDYVDECIYLDISRSKVTVYAILNSNIIKKDKLIDNINRFNNTFSEYLFGDNSITKLINNLPENVIDKPNSIKNNQLILELPGVWIYNKKEKSLSDIKKLNAIIFDIVYFDERQIINRLNRMKMHL